MPRRVHELATPARDATELLTHDLGRAPSPGEVADFIGVSEREVLDAMVAEDVRADHSLDAPDATSAACRPNRWSAGSTAGSSASRTARRLMQSLERLPTTTASCCRCTSSRRSTQTQIAEVLGCSQMQVSRLLRKAIHRLRRLMVDS